MSGLALQQGGSYSISFDNVASAPGVKTTSFADINPTAPSTNPLSPAPTQTNNVIQPAPMVDNVLKTYQDTLAQQRTDLTNLLTQYQTQQDTLVKTQQAQTARAKDAETTSQLQTVDAQTSLANALLSALMNSSRVTSAVNNQTFN